MEKKNGLELLREPFLPNQISKLPKPTINNEEWKKLPKGKCKECGGYHATTNTIHLDFVGHAALTDRLLDADPLWTWEPFALRDGLPAFDATGGLWIRLTVCGHTRAGYGHAKSNTYAEIGSREKEVIGDALRNAAMRFGAALDLWHKGELHIEDDNAASEKPKSAQKEKPPKNTEQDVGEPKVTAQQKIDIRSKMVAAGITVREDQLDFYNFVMSEDEFWLAAKFLERFDEYLTAYKKAKEV